MLDIVNTIAAISTPRSAGGIGIIRISGPESTKIADKVFVSSSGAKLINSKGYRAHFGKIICDGKILDEAVCLVFRAPKSYTGEDVVEISLHGGMYVVTKALSAVLSAGARPAEAGEFTKRAFLNGKLDLSEAEAVMNIISAEGEQAAFAAANALDGALSRKIRAEADKLIAVSATLAAWVDYPDDETEEMAPENMLSVFISVRDSLEKLLTEFESGQAVTQGVNAAIVGRPNVGKSTLMNLLTGFERSIVTSYAGTTRDVVEETVRLGNVVLRLADTAGIRDTENPVESIGVGMAKKKLSEASLVLAVFDGSEELSDEDRELLKSCKNKRAVAVINKTDLEKTLDKNEIKRYINDVVEISAFSGEGRDELSDTVERILGTDRFDSSSAMLGNERQKSCCEKAVKYLSEAIEAVKSGVTADAVNVCADSCIEALLEITGEKAGEAVVNEIFSRFCVGK
ncbi:MAG: tRNA uridine-5-carboxymethylaminomethyl(34) synthesis GTPase MnmE [Clostridiales bacterium]|nr:tRNA uridine-5-carboxymethylaminomethyl(34) synthesis GTPase MnmE [Clostridiales bacterium]